MRSKTLLAGVAAGAVLGAGGIVAADVATESAEAQGGFTLTTGQLKINQNISSAAVRRSNRGLNYLAPIRTQQTDNADNGSNGVTPLANVPGSGDGWTNSQIADEAINSEKIAPGGVTSGDLANNSVTGEKIDTGAVTGAKVAAGAIGTEQLADAAVTSSKLANPTLFATVAPATPAAAIVRGRGATDVIRQANGSYRVVFNREVTGCTWLATYGQPNNAFVDAKWATVRGRAENNQVGVVIRDFNGNQIDGDGFHVQVLCP